MAKADADITQNNFGIELSSESLVREIIDINSLNTSIRKDQIYYLDLIRALSERFDQCARVLTSYRSLHETLSGLDGLIDLLRRNSQNLSGNFNVNMSKVYKEYKFQSSFIGRFFADYSPKYTDAVDATCFTLNTILSVLNLIERALQKFFDQQNSSEKEEFVPSLQKYFLSIKQVVNSSIWEFSRLPHEEKMRLNMVHLDDIKFVPVPR